MTFRIKNVQKVRRGLMKRGRDFNQALAEALLEEGEEIKARAQEIVPYDTGALHDSIGAATHETDFYLSLIVDAGGPQAPHAYHIHETNKVYRNGKQWKFIETPLKEASRGFANRVARRTKARLK